MGKVTVRAGHEVLHFASPGDVARYKAACLEAGLGHIGSSCAGSDAGSAVVDCSSPGELSVGVLQASMQAVDKLHGSIIDAIPDLHGPAMSSFGTALRARPVRKLLGGVQVRGVELARLLGHISDAADAGRHLRLLIINQAQASLAQPLQVGLQHDCHGRDDHDSLAGLGYWCSDDVLVDTRRSQRRCLLLERVLDLGLYLDKRRSASTGVQMRK